MELIKIKGNSYYINAPTNIGVYIFKNKNCLLIDTGINNTQARKIDEILTSKGLHPKIIVNTHHHLDHCGGNNYFKNTYPGCITYTSAAEKVYIENSELYNNMLFSSSASKDFEWNSRHTLIDYVLEYGINKIEDEKFEILSLPGHSIEHIGIITPEKVCFCGDSLFSLEIIEKYNIPYLFDIAESLKTLESFKNISVDYFVPGHAKDFLIKDQTDALADINMNSIKKYEIQIEELLEQPLTREELLESLAVLNELNMDFKHYHLNFSTVSAYIKYLRDKELIEYSIENGKLYYYRK